MPKKKTKDEEVFFVGVKDPIEIRRTILESSKEMVQYLQRAERFKKLRNEKKTQIEKLKEDMKNITSLTKKLKAKLPKTALRAQIGKHQKKVKIKEKIEEEREVVQEKVIKQPTTELQKLESELNKIESRLSKMS